MTLSARIKRIYVPASPAVLLNLNGKDQQSRATN